MAGRDEIDRMVTAFNISGGDSIINPACSFYQVIFFWLLMVSSIQYIYIYILLSPQYYIICQAPIILFVKHLIWV